MTPNPRTISPELLAAEAVEMMERYKINQLVVVDEAGCLLGALNLHDLFAAQVI
jgi:arabinose-5-phosphate isomerase